MLDALCARFFGNCLVKHVKIHFLSKLAMDAFGQHKLRYILCSRWHGTGLVNTKEIHFMSSHEWERSA
jgi:hypothetical protein